MLKQFYEKALPTQGVYCATGIDPTTQGRVQNKFAESVDDVLKLAEDFISKGWNTYVALGSFDGYSRRAEDCLYFRSLFVDLDVDEEKAIRGRGYNSKEDALAALDKFLEETGLPPPIRIDSGTGVHAYWLLEEDVPVAEYLLYAEKFKTYVLERLHADPAVMADAARIMRHPTSFNHKTNPPSPARFIDTEFNQYSFDAFKEFLGPIELSSSEILKSLPKGLDDETKAMLKMDNFDTTFQKIVERTLEGDGCNQILYALEHEEDLEEPMWHSVLTIAASCSDGREAAHKLSSGYKGYSASETDKKFDQIVSVKNNKDGGPHSCSTFDFRNPGVCEGCPHRGNIKNPIQLGKTLLVARTPSSEPAEEGNQEESVRATPSAKKVPEFPDYLAPFVRGVNGGIYYAPPPKYGKDGKPIEQDAVLISQHDFFPTKRMYSTYDGECFIIRLILPNDAPREFLLPMKMVYAQDKLKEVLTSNGVFFNQNYTKQVSEYIVKWGQYLINTGRAEIMRAQMGWHEKNSVFVIGKKEITMETGPEGRPTPISPIASNIVKSLHCPDYKTDADKAAGLQEWIKAANKLNQPSLEMQAFGLLCGFGSPLMEFVSTNGVVVSFEGKSGVGKSGALNAAFSIWGEPCTMSVFDSTDNAMNSRILTSKNIIAGVDEAGDKDPKVIGGYIHKIAQGTSKLRLSGTTMSERNQEMQASLIGFMTTNHSLLGIIKTKKKTPYGEAARMVEFYIHKPQAFIDDPGKGPEIFGVFDLHYGLAGPVYVHNIMSWGEKRVKETIQKWVDRFRGDFGHDSAYRYYDNLIGVAFAGAEIAAEANLIDLDLDRIYKKVTAEIIHMRDGGTRINEVDFESILGEFINENFGGTLSVMNEKVINTPSPNKKLCIRADFDEGKTYVSTSAMDKYLSEQNISEKEFLFHMKEKGIYEGKKRMRMATHWRGAPNEYNINAYIFGCPPPEVLKQPLELVDDGA